tara:strand:+ start:546 stop:1043 length:498 start_codon:yes stop_codon:yes gene_type:complete
MGMTKNNRKQKNTLLIIIAGVTVCVLLLMSGLLIGDKAMQTSDIVVYKSSTCDCCDAWVEHLEKNGFIVETHNQQNMNLIKLQLGGVPRNLQSCHTAKVDNYLIEGHVPADIIVRLLNEKPQIKGIAVPGMPMGSPGMEGPRNDPYDILAFKENGNIQVYASRNQ